MDAKHIICFRINGQWYKTPIVYSEEEFERLMEMIDWEMPFDMKTYHFHGSENERNPVMKERPVMEFDVERLLRTTPDHSHTYLDTCLNRPLKVQKQLERYVIARSTADDCLYFVDTEDDRYRRVAQYKTVPINLRSAREFVDTYHRHCSGVKWHKFSIALESDDEIAGVAIASTPKAPGYDNRTLELNRVCAKPDYQNACSKLISTIVNIGKSMGYKTFISYTLMGEDGTSFRAAGFEFDGYTANSKDWNSPSRPRKMPERYPPGRKKRWILRTK